MLHYYLDLPLHEVAAIAGIPVGTGALVPRYLVLARL
ncbi:MAG TPA: hypothetical protein VI384_01480 [Candidatus Dormibacteraeota bacterium]